MISRQKKALSLIVIIVVIVPVAILLPVFFNSKNNNSKDLESGPVCYADNTESNPSSQEGSNLPQYTEQLSLSFIQQLGNLIQYNVSAVQQNETYGNGPTYTLDGRTDANFWYQVGLSWSPIGPNLEPLGRKQFVFFYEVWNVSSVQSVFPQNGFGGALNFSGPINEGDTVLLSLEIFNKNSQLTAANQVVMSARDWNTGAAANISYSAENATKFVSAPNTSFRSDLLTEWYVTSPQFCSSNKVLYSSSEFGLNSAEMCVAEVDYSNSSVIYNSCSGPMTLRGSSLVSFSYMGHTVYASPHQFVTS
jgi:hypothetical protein